MVRDQLTAFIGINNAGKSSVLRFFYEFRDLFVQARNPNGLKQAVTGAGQPISVQGATDPFEVFSNRNDRGITVTLRCEDEKNEWPDSNILPLKGMRLHVPRLDFHHQTPVWMAELETVNGWQQDGLHWWSDEVVGPSTQQQNFAPYLDALKMLGRTFYIPAFRNAIQTGGADYYDVQIGAAFIQQWNAFKVGPNKATNEAALRVEAEIARIFGLDSFSINAASSAEALQVFINGRSFRLHEVGGGMAQFIMALGWAATKSPELILIDEPELNLHPALQLDFLTTLASLSSRGVLFATHSLGLARAAGETIYSVRQEEEGVSEIHELEATPDPAVFLGELGFSAYSDIGADRVLLVEGQTDVKVMQRLLRLYGTEHRMAILPLGGRSAINERATEQLTEIQRLSPRVAVVIDSERLAANAELEAPIAAFAETCRDLDIPCLVLELRAIENYFSERAVKQAKGPKFRALSPFERLSDADPTWGKRENWRIAHEMRRDEIDHTDLGRFLEDLVED